MTLKQFVYISSTFCFALKLKACVETIWAVLLNSGQNLFSCSEVLACYYYCGSITDLLICWGDGLCSTTVRAITSRSDLMCGIVRLVTQRPIWSAHYREYWSHITLAISRWRSPKKLNCRKQGGHIWCFSIQSETFHHSNFIHYIKLFNKVCSLFIDAVKKYKTEFKISLQPLSWMSLTRLMTWPTLSPAVSNAWPPGWMLMILGSWRSLSLSF